ncbi:hypothetical protein AW67_24280 [Salmonella enterica subsp. enterica serovar Montevideo str. USDA-ARS-USMARC-1903]|uniref:Uncharacterized protein n=1 Tax=Salmonella enterica subsp. enterica serovar Rubislaw str. A4-653 TaxID=913081 RepID=G5QI72_SALRU|nr:hypothetical protein AW67_24280 [Salmonella enterica subsp. enterica serovar Montevideo str. USDA-ARS-USMARC-1903]EHC51192.1 hypothetical protein LTSEGIV_1856 [Salmonella enterica subsp. enterica serovar Give str. S5-487]EHC65384.1 hypothetical protein LTSEJOH_2276 [Salmonella enterica subsp. enterica serovar Johannesburg str. S5-703]EHC89863.1 hypothetical protein LTSERUB_2218 [Salmonella enterica subsp. enterica serovar Rubislaw str. A4-653]
MDFLSVYPVFHARADKFRLNKMSVCSQNSGSITRIWSS